MTENRHISSYTLQEKIWRLLWAIVQATFFRYSFHTWSAWRIFLLKSYGAEIDSSCIIRRTVKIECPWNLKMGRNSCLGDGVIVYSLGKILIGDRVSISQYAHLCAGTHDYNDKDMPLLRLPITIENDVWLAAGSFVGPNVTVGEGAILGARSVAMRDLDPWTIYNGNPAVIRRTRDKLA
ncbi:MAG: putative colanic acid biosynthesis acetyltransferase [Phycisphaerae bacterium]|jgi:putative colanic acid biosynthesis acetyltransferase WcaF|nr:putative colanic acid biosynthesis acetyltransferase [Phycisphaerae bacterium]MBT5365294.1 putative colanic acid biosynthesis acetyltransferase [Phycisphaerae bacterium]MBT6270183.1 putative colanic acid biosynthesis acetyltransferase [Phycisphaerae bacterium]MBT6283257.1 putative colanic acid biosynthesis acetyltransferase [Phycisphaerae bacterium]